MDTGIRCETVKLKAQAVYGRDGLWNFYQGRIAVYENGKRLYSKTCSVQRISRGDAMQDAALLRRDLQMQNFTGPVVKTI